MTIIEYVGQADDGSNKVVRIEVCHYSLDEVVVVNTTSGPIGGAFEESMVVRLHPAHARILAAALAEYADRIDREAPPVR